MQFESSFLIDFVQLDHSHMATQYNYTVIEEMKAYCRVMLSGGAVCLIFWTVVLILWPFYQPKIARAGQNVTINGMKKDYGYHPLLPASLLTEEHIENTEHAVTETIKF